MVFLGIVSWKGDSLFKGGGWAAFVSWGIILRWDWVSHLFLKSKFLVNFPSIFLDRIELPQVIFYSFSKLSCQVMSQQTPYVQLVKETTKLKKITKNNDEKMTKFLQYLESSGKFRKKFLCKVYRSIYIGSNSLKNQQRSPF